MHKANRLFLISASLFLIACSGVYSFGMQDIVESKILPVKESLNISTGSGKVTVRASQVSEISVEVVYTYSSTNYEPVFLVEDNTITLKEEFRGLSRRGRATWSVTVPKNTKVSCSTGSGDVVIEGIQREVDISSGSGSVSVKDCETGVRASTGSGPVQFENIKGESSVNTGSGRIVMHGVQGSIQCNNGSGGADIRDSRGSFSINSGSGDITVSQALIEGPGKFGTGSGDIQVSLAGSTVHDLALGTGSGKAVLSYGGHSIVGFFEFTAMENRGKIVSPFTFDEETIYTQGGQTYMRKSFTREDDKPRVTISTGSGTAELRKR